MDGVSIYLLGQWQVRLHGERAEDFRSDKVRALLSYLVVEKERSHRRDELTTLLWPEMSDAQARNNLRVGLHRMRQALNDLGGESSYFRITRESVSLETMAPVWVDVTTFDELISESANHPHVSPGICRECLERLEQAAELYKGEFLQGFLIADSVPFSEWALLKREGMHRCVLAAMEKLSGDHQRRGELEKAQHYAEGQLELEPWREEATQQLMLSQLRLGQRSAAPAQYERCRTVLDEELGVAPSAGTAWLYEQIREGTLSIPERPSPLVEMDVDGVVQRPTFVARERQLAELEGFLEEVLRGKGQIVFVTGEAGSGKTMLAAEFCRRALADHPELVAGLGASNAFAGVGDPYAPFREIIDALTGNTTGIQQAISTVAAERLLLAAPDAIQALLSDGPALVGRFVSVSDLLARALTETPGGMGWLEQIQQLVMRGTTEDGDIGQENVFEQVTRLLSGLSEKRPLLLVLDDVQWADTGTISLLFYLGRHLAGSRLLLVGLFRESEVVRGRDGEPHPLEQVLEGLRRKRGEIQVDLSALEEGDRRHFVDAYLDTEPNRLDESFRQALYRHTAGNPLFTAEVRQAIREVTAGMLDPPISNLGVKGIRTAFRRTRKWPEMMDEETLRWSCFNIFIFIDATGGTGGGIFRYMYGRFLQEAAGICGDDRLAMVGEELRKIGDIWQEVASSFKEASEVANVSDALYKAIEPLPVIADREEAAWQRLRSLVD